MKLDENQLARSIEMAMDAAAEESTDTEDAHYDVRWSQDRGIYIVLREHADGGTPLWTTAGGFEPSRHAARKIMREMEEPSRE